MKRSSRVIILTVAGLVSGLMILLFGWLMMFGLAQAANCDVPSDVHPTIQSAMGDSDCTTINLVAPHYEENVTVDRSVTIQGQGMDSTTVDGKANDTVFTIQPGLTVTLTGLTIRNGRAVGDPYLYGGGAHVLSSTLSLLNVAVLSNTANLGGGIYASASDLIVQDSQILSNTATVLGGGIAGARITVKDSIIANNEAGKFGGGINGRGTVVGSTISRNKAEYGGGFYGTLTVTHSLVDNNLATWSGGGFYTIFGRIHVAHSTIVSNTADLYYGGGILGSTGSTVEVESSTFAGNLANEQGGAICFFGNVLSVANSTLNQNAAEEGGGVYNGGVVTIANTTINENAALFSGGGIHNTGIMNWSNSLIANSPTGGDCYNIGTIANNINNLVEDGSCSAVFNGDPLLGPLQDNGGSTWTQALLDASPAVDAGDNASCMMTDQRGIKRPQDGNGDGSAVCDIGAFEIGYYQLYLPVILKLN